MYILKRIGLLFLFSLAGAVIMYFFSWASLRRGFVKWESLGRPSSNATKVVALDYVQTASGDIYQYAYKSVCNGYCWFKSDAPPPDSEFWLPLSACGSLPSLENYVDSKAVCDTWGTGLSLTITAIDNNGFVYSWNDKFGGEWESVTPWLSSFIGAAAGLFIGLIILLVILFSDLLKRLQKRAQQKGVPESVNPL